LPTLQRFTVRPVVEDVYEGLSALDAAATGIHAEHEMRMDYEAERRKYEAEMRREYEADLRMDYEAERRQYEARDARGA
jgi:hypothetical protein